VRNEKGGFTMEKVKVARYVTGKRPDYAPEYSSDEEEEMEMGLTAAARKTAAAVPEIKTDAEKEDRRLRRLQNRQQEQEEDEEQEEEEEYDRVARHRRLQEPELLGNSDEESELEEGEEEEGEAGDESSDEEELDDEEIERRRDAIRKKMKETRDQNQKPEEEMLDKEEEKSEDGEEEEESSEYEEYTDSEEEDTGPRLKPVFVRKKDRITIIEKEQEELKLKEKEVEDKRVADERRRSTLKIVEEEARKEAEGIQSGAITDEFGGTLTDDDNDEEEYEAWKVRELKRMKRDREERETIEKERSEIDRLRNLTEEERKMESKTNPKEVTNKATKGKYKFLQKYYHRGAFFLDKEDAVYTRDFAQATLEDHFDKTILPKVMQVKNFGRSGRTKYTHLVDQDTTQFDSPWQDTTASIKFHMNKGGGMKQTFDRPSTKQKKS